MALIIDQNFRRQDSALHGVMPSVWYSDLAVDGDAYPWDIAGIGSIYVRVDLTNNQVMQVYQKMASALTDQDWVGLAGMGVVTQRVAYTDFTDGGGASGTLTLNQQIPAGAFVVRSVVYVETAVGGTTPTLTIGDGTDADRYNTSTIAVATTGYKDGGAISGTAVTTAASNVVLTMAEATDFGLIDAGVLTVKVFYHF